MLYPIKTSELNRLIPGVASGPQFNSALGSPQKILQRLMISSIGGVITLLIAQSQVASQFYAMWLIIGVVFLLYILWGPILESSKRNSKLRKFPYAAIFDGKILDIYTREKITNRKEQANKLGQLEMVEDRRTWLFLELGDEDGYLGEISFPMDKKHQVIRIGSNIICLVLSNRNDFEIISALTDAWIPNLRLWVGEYPFLLKPAFEEICGLRIPKQSNRIG